MNFAKYEGLGNDFVIFDCRLGHNPLDSSNNSHSTICRICDRNFGVGADGIIVIVNSDCGYFVRMRIYNADGSEPEMCGNGIRCLVRFLYDRDEIYNDEIITIETLAGPITASINEKNQIKVDMGQPFLNPLDIPTKFDVGPFGIPESNLDIEGKIYRVCSIGMGNPHLIVFVPNLIDVRLRDWGSKLESNSNFPKKTNVHFVHVENRYKLNVLVWERGAGPTLACGTGACACLVASSKLGFSETQADVSLPGGILTISWPSDDSRITMLGPSNYVYTGNLNKAIFN